MKKYIEYVIDKVTKRDISGSLDKLEPQEEMKTGVDDIKRKLNNVDKCLQNILTKGEQMLKKRQGILYTAEI